MTPQNFLRWYAPLIDSLFPPRFGGIDSKGNYILPLQNTERYLAILRRSGYVSPAYLARRREQFQQVRDSLRLNPQNDGPIEGLNYDPIIYGQDRYELLPLLTIIPALTSYSADSARVELSQMDTSLNEFIVLEFRLSASGKRWLIDEIRQLRRPLPRSMQADSVREPFVQD